MGLHLPEGYPLAEHTYQLGNEQQNRQSFAGEAESKAETVGIPEGGPLADRTLPEGLATAESWAIAAVFFQGTHLVCFLCSDLSVFSSLI